MIPRKELTEAHKRIIREEYSTGKGLKAISNSLGHCVGVIRRELVDQDITIRPIGRPRRS